MADNIDSLKFDIVLDSKKFESEMKRIEGLASEFNKSVQKALAITNLLDATQSKGSRSIADKAARQKEVVTLTRQELEARKAAGTITKQELVYLNDYIRNEKLVLDEQKKQLQVQNAQAKLQRQQNLLANGQGKEIALNTNQLIKQNAAMKGISSLAAQYLSVFGAATIVRNLVRITGEFEAQHVALRAILQDTAAADNIYNQLQVLAVKSPYTFQNLVSYAKQLTAFSIPVNEVYETTKKLADVSAGLGVDLGRIILAYGQVRSAEFLRGQEVRQFTEAGIPILQELADQFQEIEGHAISVGEVFERISARQVPFAMVEEAFNRMTSAGGKFYNMQEVLAETVKGKISNLQDAWEIMLSRIGDENSGTIKNFVNGLTNLLANYEKWIGIVGALIKYVGLYSAAMLTLNTITKAANGLQAIKNGLDLVSNQQIKLSTILLPTNNALEKISIKNKEEEAAAVMTLNLARKAAMGILAALAAIIWTVIQRGKAAREEARKTTDTINGALSKLQAMSLDFEIGMDRVFNSFVKMKSAEGDATKETKEFNKSVDDLKKQFPKFVDDNMRLAQTVADLGQYWAKAREEMNQYYADEARESIRTDLQKNREESQSDIQKKFTKYIQGLFGTREWNASGKNVASLAWRYVIGDINRNEILNTVDILNSAFQRKQGNSVDYSNSILREFDKFVEKYKDITNGYVSALDAADAAISASSLSTTRKNINDYIATLTEDASLLLGSDVNIDKFAENLRERYASSDTTEAIKGVIRQIFDQFPKALGQLSNELTGWRKDIGDYVASHFGSAVAAATVGLGTVPEKNIAGAAAQFRIQPTDQLDDLVENWIKDLDETQKSLNLIPSKYRNLDNPTYESLLLHKTLLETISESLYGNKNFDGNLQKSGSGKSSVQTIIDDLKQRFQDLKELKAAYDKFKELGFDNAGINGILMNYFGVGIPDGGFNAAFESLAAQMQKYSPNDAKDIRNYVSGKDWRSYADEIENASAALKKYNDEVTKLLAKDYGLEGTGLEYKISKILTNLSSENISSEFSFEQLAKTVDQMEAKIKASVKGTEEYKEQYWEKYRRAALEKIRNLYESEKAYNAKVAQEKITELAKSAVTDNYTRLFGAGSKALTDMGDKTYRQVTDIIEKLKQAKLESGSFIDKTLFYEAERLGVSFGELLNAINEIINADIDKAFVEKVKKAKNIASSSKGILSDISSIISGLGDSFDSDILRGLSDAFDMVDEIADVVLSCDDAVLSVAKTIEGVTDEADNIAKSFSVITMVVKVLIVFIKRIASIWTNVAKEEVEAAAMAIEYKKALLEVNAASQDGIFGDSQWQKILTRMIEYQKSFKTLMNNVEEIYKKGTILDKFIVSPLVDENGVFSLAKTMAAYEAGVFNDETNAIIENAKNLQDAVSSIFGQIADDIVSNMVAAFEETGDSVSNLENAFSDMGETLVKSILKSYILENVLNKYKDSIYNIIDKYNNAEDSQSGILNAVDEVSAIFSRMSDDLEGLGPFFNRLLEKAQEEFGSFASMNNGDTLASGIKGITEDTANLLASYLNAIRADVAYGRLQRDKVVALLEGHTVQYTTLNDYLMKVQANTANIAESNRMILDHIESVLTSEGGATAIRIYT